MIKPGAPIESEELKFLIDREALARDYQKAFEEKIYQIVCKIVEQELEDEDSILNEWRPFEKMARFFSSEKNLMHERDSLIENILDELVRLTKEYIDISPRSSKNVPIIRAAVRKCINLYVMH